MTEIPVSKTSDQIDVAVNIFAKPFQTALSLLSLLRQSAHHLGTIWLQFEPYGSKYDPITPYFIAYYLQEKLGNQCQVFQPDYWLDLNAPDPAQLHDPAYRMGIRYQYAFEHSQARWLFLMHNDVFFYRDLLGDMYRAAGDAFAIGQLGQCWNCPAGMENIMQEVLHRPACDPTHYAEFRPDAEQLHQIYTLALERGLLSRYYDCSPGSTLGKMPWPLPECRINEWACLINLEKTRQYTIPFGKILPPGAYHKSGNLCLDIGVEWFRGMHRLGMRARNFILYKYMHHWVGTGKKAKAGLYLEVEYKALKLLQQHFLDYLLWLDAQTGRRFSKVP